MKYGFGVALVAVVPLLAAANEPTVEFARDVAPILQRSCIGCHGPGTRTAGLDLHDAALILRGTGNGPVIVRGASQESVLIRRVREGSMPPGGKNRLSESEIAVLERWIDQGAPGAGAVSGVQSMHSPEVKDEDRAFWSFRVLRSPRVPAVRQEKLIGTPVDAFLLQKLEQQGLTYTNRAGAATLARRAHLDLLGLPPTPGDVSRFAQDNSP